MQKIFDAGNMNEDGICRGWVCDWISRSKAGQVIASRYDLGSGHHVKGLWDAAADNDGIDANFGLIPKTSIRNASPPISALWLTTELTKGTGFFIFGVRGRTLNVSTGSYDDSGHAMATRKGMGRLQFFDPNEGLLEFDSSIEFYDYLPNYIRTTYPDLLSREGEVKKF